MLRYYLIDSAHPRLLDFRPIRDGAQLVESLVDVACLYSEIGQLINHFGIDPVWAECKITNATYSFEKLAALFSCPKSSFRSIHHKFYGIANGQVRDGEGCNYTYWGDFSLSFISQWHIKDKSPVGCRISCHGYLYNINIGLNAERGTPWQKLSHSVACTSRACLVTNISEVADMKVPDQMSVVETTPLNQTPLWQDTESLVTDLHS